MVGDHAETAALRELASVDFELALLARLTTLGLKPLARYEAELPAAGVDALGRLGLVSVSVRRLLVDGGVRLERVFSRSTELVGLYQEVFAERPVVIDRGAALVEGHLFGFPPCCVVHYIDEGYADNSLPVADQAELFYWACPGCEITPRLLPRYLAARRELEARLGQ